MPHEGETETPVIEAETTTTQDAPATETVVTTTEDDAA